MRDNEMNEFDYGKNFITFADLPPDPTSETAIEDYKKLGFSVCLLTEDKVPFVKDGHLSEEYKRALKRLSESGMQVWIRNMYNDCDYFELAAEKKSTNYGSDYCLQPRSVGDAFSAFPAVTGFYMADEPYLHTNITSFRWAHAKAEEFACFDGLKKLAKWRNKNYPKAFFHVNHVPSMSYDHFFPQGDKIFDYGDFLAAYTNVLKEVQGNQKSLCLDSYPLLDANSIDADYLFDLLTGATVVSKFNDGAERDNGAVFGMCLQTFHLHSTNGDGRHRDIYSAEEITFQIYTGMALGARLFEYFCYRSYPGGIDGILRLDGSKRIYDLVLEANRRTLDFGALLYSYKWKGAFACAGSVFCDNAQSLVKCKNLFRKSGEADFRGDYDLLVGCFEKENAQAFMLVNFTDPIKKLANKVTIKSACKNVDIYFDCLKKQTIENPDGSFTFEIPCGGGAFVCFENRKG